jgi:type III secretion protein L
MRLAAQLKDGGLRLLPEQRLLKAADVKAIADVRALLDQVAAEAERSREAAKEAYEEAKRQGYDDGLAAGKDQVAGRLVELSDQGAALVSDLEARIPEIVMSALRQILGTFDDTEVVIRTLRQALRMFRHQTDLTIRVPPDRFEEVRARIQELRADSGTGAYVEVVADRHLAAGGCVLESELGSVDAGIEAQLAVLERAMRRELAGRSGEPALPRAGEGA